MSFVPLPTDTASGAVIAITIDHRRIHAGEMFAYGDSLTLGNGDVQDYVINTGTMAPHMRWALEGTMQTAFTAFEGGDRTGTTAQTILNLNRNSANTPLTAIYKGHTGGTTDGVQIYGYSGGSSSVPSRQASHSNGEMEYVLKPNTQYILRVTSGGNGNLCNVLLSFYEHSFGAL